MTAEDATIEHIRKLEKRLLQPAVRESSEEMTKILADCFTEFGSSGRVYNKQQTVQEMEGAIATEISMADFEARLLTKEVILVTYRVVKVTGPEGGKSRSLRSSLWQLIDGRWQLVFHQGTPTTVDR
jgi:hypothetical protein